MKEIDISDIKTFKPLSEAFKKVGKYFKNSTLAELKDKIHNRRNIISNRNELNFDSNSSLLPFKKDSTFYVKIKLDKYLLDKENKANERLDKINDILKRRKFLKEDENNNIYPGKYVLNYDSVSKKIQSVVMKDRTVYNKLKHKLNNTDNKINKINLINLNNSEVTHTRNDSKDNNEMEKKKKEK